MMKTVVIWSLVVVLLMINDAKSCNPAKEAKKTRRDVGSKDHSLRYELLTTLDRFCENKRSDIGLHKIRLDSKRQNCDGLVKGLEKIQHATSKHYFRRDSNDVEPQREKMFDFTCVDGLVQKCTYYKGQLVPPEVKALYSTPGIQAVQHVISTKTLLKEFESEINDKKPNNMFMEDLAALDLKLNDQNFTAAFMSLETQVYNAQLHHWIEPTDEVLSDFENLPKLTPMSVVDYYLFTSRYGTHVQMGSIFGGRLMILVSHRDVEATVSAGHILDLFTFDAIIDEVLQMHQGEDTKISIFSAGGTPEIRDVNSWLLSVESDPVPMTYDYIPVHEFITKGNSTPKCKSLDQVESYEKDVNFLKKVYFEIESLKPLTRLGQYMLSLVSEECDQVCSSQKFVKIVKSKISDTANFALTKYFINCTYKLEKVDEIILEHRMFFVLPGICLTSMSITNECVQVNFVLPPGNGCFKFYKKNDCVSQGRTVKTKDDIKKEIGGMRSISLC